MRRDGLVSDDIDRGDELREWYAEDTVAPSGAATYTLSEDDIPPDDAPDPFDAEGQILYQMSRLRISREARRRLETENRPALNPPPVRPFAEWIDKPISPVRYRIEGLAPTNARVLLSAQYKAGKTRLVGNQVRALADRDKFLDHFTVNTGAEHIVVIDDELDEDMLREWLCDQNIRNRNAVAEVIPLRGLVASFNILDDHIREQWVRRLRDHGCDYLILDCLRPVLDACGLDESREAGQFLLAFDELCSQAGVNDSTLIHHMGHNNERSRGDSRLLDWPDVTWKVIRSEPDNPASGRYFSAYGRGVNIPEGRLTYDPDTHRLTYVGGSRGDADVEAAFRAVIELLAILAKEDEDDTDDGRYSISKNKIEGDVGLSDHKQKAVRGAINLAIKRGLVEAKDGPRKSQMCRIKCPCSECGYPVMSGRSRHESCTSETEGLFE
jgi:hypothetical protein